MQAATSAPASRSRPESPVAAALDTAKPSPPSAITTTLRSAGPLEPISPAVEQPISGTSPGAMPSSTRLEVEARAREDDQGAQIRAAVNGRRAGFGPGAERIRVGRLADPYPASSSHHLP